MVPLTLETVYQANKCSLSKAGRSSSCGCMSLMHSHPDFWVIRTSLVSAHHHNEKDPESGHFRFEPNLPRLRDQSHIQPSLRN